MIKEFRLMVSWTLGLGKGRSDWQSGLLSQFWLDMAKYFKDYVCPPPSLSEFAAQTDAVSGGDLLEGKGVERSDGSFKRGCFRWELLR